MGDVWKALADPTRRKILKLLKKGSLNAGEIAAEFNMTKPSISNHLSILKQADLVDSEASSPDSMRLEDIPSRSAGHSPLLKKFHLKN